MSYIQLFPWWQKFNGILDKVWDRVLRSRGKADHNRLLRSDTHSTAPAARLATSRPAAGEEVVRSWKHHSQKWRWKLNSRSWIAVNRSRLVISSIPTFQLRPMKDSKAFRYQLSNFDYRGQCQGKTKVEAQDCWLALREFHHWILNEKAAAQQARISRVENILPVYQKGFLSYNQNTSKMKTT